MQITLSEIEAALEQGLGYVQALAPLAGSLGGPAGIAIGNAVSQAAGVASAILTQVEGDATIIASGDLTKIRALEVSLQAENAALIAQVAAS